MTTLDVIGQVGQWLVETQSGARYVITCRPDGAVIDVLEPGLTGPHTYLVVHAHARLVAADRVREDSSRESGVRIGSGMHLVIETDPPLGIVAFETTALVTAIAAWPTPRAARVRPRGPM